MSEWTTEDRFFRYRTPWVTFYGEHLIDEAGKRLEYYRVEKADSIIVIPEQKRKIVIPEQQQKKEKRKRKKSPESRYSESEWETLLYTPREQYRPGLGRATLDFPGGRVDEKAGLLASAARILEKELGITEVVTAAGAAPAEAPPADPSDTTDSAAPSQPVAAETTVELLTPRGYPLNSSFSDQKLYFALARIGPELTVPAEYLGRVWTVDREGVDRLLEELECAQCRLALLEYIL